MCADLSNNRLQEQKCQSEKNSACTVHSVREGLTVGAARSVILANWRKRGERGDACAADKI